MACFKGREDFWPVTGWMGQEVECMEENQDKLNHLHLGQVLFPPQNLMSSQGSKCVVRVPVFMFPINNDEKMNQKNQDRQSN